MLYFIVNSEPTLAQDWFELKYFGLFCTECPFEIGPDFHESLDVIPLLDVLVPTVFAFTEHDSLGKVLIFLVYFKLSQVGGDIVALWGEFLEL